MQQYSQDKRCGLNILDYFENEESKRGLYNRFTQHQGTVKQDIKQVEQSLAKDMNQFSKRMPQITDDFHLDAFLTDFDIKELLMDHLEVNSWKEAANGVKKACYRDRHQRDALPQWGLIEKQQLRK